MRSDHGSDQVSVVIICLLPVYTFPQKKFHLSIITSEHLTFLAACLVTSLLVTSSAYVSLIQHSVSGGQKTSNSKDVSFIGI